MKYIKYLFFLVKIIIAYILAKFMLLNKKYSDVWLFSERSDEAEDNSFFLFKYVRENYFDENVYYLIDFTCNDYYKVKRYGNLINYNSFKHYVFYFLAKKHISAFQFFGVPDNPLIWKLESWGFFKKKRIFLQHGITKAMLPFLTYEETKYNLFICGAEPEYQYIKNHFGYPEQNIKYLGFCRFDNLHESCTKKQILIMPTWRQWIGMTSKRSISLEDKEKFIGTEYFQKYQSLLNNIQLIEFLKREKIQLLFYPHPEMQKYIDLFESNSSYIEIIDRCNSNLQNLLKECLLFVTDYSSIAFDRAYLKKPLIYYQFDQEKYYQNHFKKGFFDEEANGFGPVIKEENDLINSIIEIYEKGEVNNTYINRIVDFFPLYDKNNCERNYEAIKRV
ncbi:MAG: CDP-glycerol glycerophosphotransferase family protein [Turicibacter sanguinis]|uniref:CDP-glycerol glycerophosphotransferase family protein n=1 Tax=Turicibacter sanguinis TaxID=154288 RepID=UPI0011CB207E|nr:CDP-glycerol glycerophosphotransferase family protein [Turicibacter sanguinis]MDB8551677.1 CDP-glycerol glycerophosphotransferase family protein [Turicibacter sanguinis]MTP73718.1 teichoic acid biosynthesis protein B [Turicibacter sanguinis]